MSRGKYLKEEKKLSLPQSVVLYLHDLVYLLCVMMVTLLLVFAGEALHHLPGLGFLHTPQGEQNFSVDAATAIRVNFR